MATAVTGWSVYASHSGLSVGSLEMSLRDDVQGGLLNLSKVEVEV